jgi:outer membrane protein TolC
MDRMNAPLSITGYATRIAIAMTLMLLRLTAGASAQTALTLDRALAIARENDIRLGIAGKGIDAAGLEQRELLRQRLPRLSFHGNALYAPTLPSFGYDPAITSGGQIGAQAVADYLLYDGGQNDLRLDRNRIDIEMLGGSRSLVERDLMLAVRLAFHDALRARGEVALRESFLQRLSDYLRLVESMYAGSIVGFTDVLRTRARVSDAKLALDDAITAADTARYALAELLGLPLDSTIAVTGSLDSIPPGPPFDPASSPDLAVAEMMVRRSRIDLDLAGLENRPVISAVADAGVLTSVDNLTLPAGERSSIVGISAGITVDLPLFNGGLADLHIAQRQIALDTARMGAALLRRTIERQEKQLRMQITRGSARLAIIRAAIDDADKNFLLTRSKYAGGGGSALEVLDAEQLLADNRLAELQTLADMQDLAARLQRLATP